MNRNRASLSSIAVLALVLLAYAYRPSFLRYSQHGRHATRRREAAIRSHYSSVEPDWRSFPPLGMQNRTSLAGQHMRMEHWYRSSAAGASPYDFVPRPLQPGESKTRVLFLLDFRDYLERMNSHSYEM